MEKTLTIIKPDATKRDLVGEILSRIETDGLSLEGIKMISLTEAQAREFYREHEEKPFYDELVEYMVSGPVVLGVVSGNNAIERLRTLMGDTDPEEAVPGTIRAEFANNITENSIHGSDSPESAQREIEFFFSKSELIHGG